MNTIVVQHSNTTVPIKFGDSPLPKGIIITDQNVWKHYEGECADRQVILLPPGESSKSMETYEELVEKLAEIRTTRSSHLIAFGGGVIGDLVGFVAATYMRGVQYTQVPTTLLAQVDSSVGGKTGIDLKAGKNLLGAFNPPQQVLINSRYLQTLSAKDFSCGMAEVIKTGFILDRELAKELDNPVANQSDSRLANIIHKCVQIKANVVAEDEFETKGIRAKLNFGHTVGHAIEKVTNYQKYTHGEAISVGMAVETAVAVRMGLAPKELLEYLKFSLSSHKLPISCPELQDHDMIVSAMRSDKKSVAGELTMALVTSPGNCKLFKDVPEDTVREVLRSNG